MKQQVQHVGRVVSLWRYPVKSMAGEQLATCEISERGLLGDRAYALVDQATGLVVSAKNPRKWPNLMDFRAKYARVPTTAAEPLPPVEITLPGSQVVTSEEPDVNDVLSAALGRPVALLAAVPASPALEQFWPDIDGFEHRDAVTAEAIPSGAFFDGAPILVVATATLQRLKKLYPGGDFDERRFRPNVLVATEASVGGAAESDWVGGLLVVGSHAQLRVTRSCPRCVMTTLPQGDLPGDVGILRAVARHSGGAVGVYGAAAKPGLIRIDDVVKLFPGG